MNYELVDTIIKTLTINICAIYILINIIKHDETCTVISTALTLAIAFIFSIILIILKTIHIPILFIVLIYLLYPIIFCKLYRIRFGFVMISSLLSFAISFIIFFFSVFIIFTIIHIFKIVNFDNPVNFILISCLSCLTTRLLFNLKKFKNGFPFLRTNYEYIEFLLLFFSIIVVSFYVSFGKAQQTQTDYLFVILIILTLLAIPILYRTFTLYHKQKPQTQALKDYEQQLSETKQKLSTALEEKQLLIKSNHEFHHRQEALMKKLDNLATQYSLGTNTEFGEDYGNLLSRINNLTSEYVEKTKSVQNLPKTNIEEIDDMLEYMKSECNTNHIEFNITIDCDINYIIDNFITKSQLETLLGDLIRNSIIAINHSNEPYRSIMLVFGIRDSFYELCIYDSGIPFEVETLVNFGIKPASTHTDEGGTGIGLLTTFETINSSNASLIIDENTHTNYTKSIKIKFDKKHEYIICTNRSAEITEKNTENRNILLRS